MWSTIDSFARPPLGRYLQGRALALNRRARCLLERAPPAPDDGRALGQTLMASAACWQLFRRGLPAPRRRLLERHLKREIAFADSLTSWSGPGQDAFAGLRRQARSRSQQGSLEGLQGRLAAPGMGASGWRRRRVLARLLAAEAAWLDELGQSPSLSEADLHAGLTRLYRKTRQAFTSRPGSAAALRRLTRLVRTEELIFAAPGHMPEVAGACERRRLLGLLEEDAWLAGLLDSAAVAAGKTRDRRRLAKLVCRRRRELAVDLRVAALMAFSESVTSYRRMLPWRTFIGLADAADVVEDECRPAEIDGWEVMGG